MRKYLLFILLIIVSILFCRIVFWGIEIADYRISSYAEIESQNIEKKKILSELNFKNNDEFDYKKQQLKEAVENYKKTKKQYDNLVETGKIKEDKVASIDLYDIDFLMTIIGNYATQKNVILQFEVVKNTSINVKSSDYVMCDLNFTITGEYRNITDFLYSIEGDNRLNFEINDFIIEKGGENLQATFTVKRIPINRKNLLNTENW